MRRSRKSTTISAGVAVIALLALAACGGDSSPTAAPTPVPTPALPAPRAVVQNSYAIERNYVYGESFTISGSGTLDVTVDYTYADSQILLWLAKGTCTGEQWSNDQCQYVASSFAGAKPRKLSATGVTAGSYVLIIWNAGPHDEGVSYQAVYTQTAFAASGAMLRSSGARVLGVRASAAR